MTEQGWVRLTPHYAEDAVAWWFVRPFDDGFVYARGGRVRSARQARKAIRDHYDASHHEHRVFLRRPILELGPAGELIPLDLPSSGLPR